jgi:hypothetical protein
VVKGETNDIKKISNIIENFKEVDDAELFQSLIGLPEQTYIDKFNNNWNFINVKWFGTTQDVGFDFAKEIKDDYILFAGYTAWSPPEEFCKKLSRLYNVQVEMYFEEPGYDFCGKCWIDYQIGCFAEVYGYQEGIYRFEGFQDWYEREWELMFDWLLDEINEEDTPDFQRTIREKIPFLNDEEVEELSIELESLVKTAMVSVS